MRGKPATPNRADKVRRITPAYAGKTGIGLRFAKPTTDHPRVCGENHLLRLTSARMSGSPPRMRGKHQQYIDAALQRRITPAYAGKTRRYAGFRSSNRDHPRVCGENIITAIAEAAPTGSPPRMRGKLRSLFNAKGHEWITPAYAGKTGVFVFVVAHILDHPRVCGENMDYGVTIALKGGSPPRMRGKRGGKDSDCIKIRITPAYAGKTLGFSFPFI